MNLSFRLVILISGLSIPVVIIAVAGRSNGLGPVIAGYTNLPVINCPPLTSSNVNQDIWSSLNVPSGKKKKKIIILIPNIFLSKNYLLTFNTFN